MYSHSQYLADARQRREQAAALRATGLSYAQIGQVLGVSRARAHQMCKVVKQTKPAPEAA